MAAITCALSPTYLVRWHYGFYPTTLLEHAIGVTVLAFIVETWRARARVSWRSPFTIPVLLFLLAGAISVVAAPNRTMGLGLYRAYIIEPIIFGCERIPTTSSRPLRSSSTRPQTRSPFFWDR